MCCYDIALLLQKCGYRFKSCPYCTKPCLVHRKPPEYRCVRHLRIHGSPDAENTDAVEVCGPWQIRDSTQQNLKNRNHGNLTKCLRHLTTVLVDVHITSQGRFSSTASLYHVPLSVMLARQPCRAQVTVYHHSEKVRDFVGVAAPLRRTSKT